MKTNDKNSLKYCLFATFGGLVFGVDAAIISGTIRFISSKFELNSLQVGTVVSIAGFGAMIALLFTGSLCNRYGRKKVLLGIAISYLISAAISAGAWNLSSLLIGRLIGGLAFCSLSITSMYIGEIASSKQRGRLVSINQLSICLGSLIAFLVNYLLVKNMNSISFIDEDNIWRYMFGSEILFNIIWIGLLIRIPESPRWLLMNGKVKEAKEIFAKIIAKENLEEEFKNIVEGIKEAANNNFGIKEQLKIMFSNRMTLVMVIGLAYAIIQQVIGINAVLFYAPTVFEQVGMSVTDSFMQTILVGIVDMLAVVIAIMFVEKSGRRKLTIIGLSIVVIAHASSWYGFHTAKYEINKTAIIKLNDEHIDTKKLSLLEGHVYKTDVELKKDLAKIYDNKELPLVQGPIIKSTISINVFFVMFGIFAFLAAFHLSVGPIMWVILSEVFPNVIRGVAIPLTGLVVSLASYLVQQLFPWQLQHLGAANTFLNYGIFAAIGLVVLVKVLPETKNKSIEDIEKLLVKVK